MTPNMPIASIMAHLSVTTLRSIVAASLACGDPATAPDLRAGWPGFLIDWSLGPGSDRDVEPRTWSARTSLQRAESRAIRGAPTADAGGPVLRPSGEDPMGSEGSV